MLVNDADLLTILWRFTHILEFCKVKFHDWWACWCRGNPSHVSGLIPHNKRSSPVSPFLLLF
jgi:hypothetical protein